MGKNEFLIRCIMQTYSDLHSVISSKKIIKNLILNPKQLPTLDAFILKSKLKYLLFITGLSHSGKNTGIFNDIYIRDGVTSNDSANNTLENDSLLLRAMYGFNMYLDKSKNKSASEIVIPCLDEHTAEKMCVLLQNSQAITKANIYKMNEGIKPIYGIRLKFGENSLDVKLLFENIREILKEIGMHGALPTKDTLLWLFTTFGWEPNHEGNILKDEKLANSIEMLSKEDSIEVNSIATEVNVISKLRNSSKESISDILSRINSKLNELEDFRHNTLLPSQQDIIELYRNYLSKLINALDLQESYNAAGSEDTKIQIKLSLYRFLERIEYATAEQNNYDNFITAVELASDEAMLLSSILHPYSKHEIFSIMRNYLTNALAIKAKENLSQVTLTGSCMSAVNTSLDNAKEYLIAKKRTPRIMVSKNVYFEILVSLELPFTSQQDLIINADGKTVTNFTDNQIADIMMLSCNYNVKINEPGFVSMDVEAKVRRQLQLRKAAKDDSQLIVVIDTTMNTLNDKQLQDIINGFSKEIKEGKLAITLAHSLNKYFQCGLDKAGAGISATFCNILEFPNLHSKHDEIIGFRRDEASVQSIAHVMQNCSDEVEHYYELTHDITKELHDKYVPKELYKTDNLIYIDRPYTQDKYQKVWGFLVIRLENLFKSNPPQRYSEHTYNEIVRFMYAIGLKKRDGFGFNESNLVTIGTSTFRICIAPDIDNRKISLLVSLLAKLNVIFTNCNNNLAKYTDEQIVKDVDKAYLEAYDALNAINQPNKSKLAQSRI